MQTEEIKILIVEDSRSIAVNLSKHITKLLGFVVEIVGTVAEARDVMEKRGNEFFVAILDLGLPDGPDGEIIDVARDYKVPSIVYTGTFDMKLREQLVGKTAIDYVIKGPQTVPNLIGIVDRLVKNTSIKVLVVDDSVMFRSYMKALLQRYMFQVLDAPCAEDALKMMKEHPDIMLVFTDYEMPGLNGVQFVEEVRRTRSQEELAIIGLSARKDVPLTVEFIKSGANDFLHKPFETEEFYWRTVKNLESLEQIIRLRELNEIKNKFMGIAAHDLRNPIGGITGFSQMLMEGLMGNLNQEQAEIVKAIHDASSHMLALVTDLLDVSVIDAGKLDLSPALGSLGDLVRDKIRINQIVADGKGIQLVTKIFDEPLCIFDTNRMAQVLDNLLGNAIKFSPRNSRVDISLAVENGEALIYVADNGPGIAPEEQDKLFLPFQRLSARPTAGERSTGLGLAIVKSIMDGHHGRVWVESELGKGSSFVIALPTSDNEHSLGLP